VSRSVQLIVVVAVRLPLSTSIVHGRSPGPLNRRLTASVVIAVPVA
jgi:hypothetical protein